jgi:hypothetical protein
MTMHALPPSTTATAHHRLGSGTEIDDWLKNSTISRCKNASGGVEPNRQGGDRHGSGSVYPNNGALWNGMIAPFINMTIGGALWYQGENNV